jgi:hypothetical protein
MTYPEYVEDFNNSHTDFRLTREGPIAKHKGVWYSVNGNRDDITDIRYPLNEKELEAYGVEND